MLKDFRIGKQSYFFTGYRELKDPIKQYHLAIIEKMTFKSRGYVILATQILHKGG